MSTREKPLPDAPRGRKGLWFKIAKLRMLAYFTECQRHGERADLALEHAIFAGMTHERDASEVREAREQIELILSALSEDQYEVFTTKVLEGFREEGRRTDQQRREAERAHFHAVILPGIHTWIKRRGD